MNPKQRMEALASTKVAYAKKQTGGRGEEAPRLIADPGDVHALLEEWPDTPKKIAAHTIDRYGPPNEATPMRLVWHGNGPWKRTIVFRHEIPHKFPTSHTDFIINYIDYRVPWEKASDVVRFDGSVIVDRTAGEVAARCDMEEMNILTLNLVHDIVTGRRTVDEARRHYADQASAFVMNREAPYAQRLLFDVPEGGTADLDESIIAEPMARQMAEKVKELIGR